jgi:DNA (cytosine-5)-methyltransferase 1
MSSYRARFRALAGLPPLNDNAPPPADTSPAALAAANGLIDAGTQPGDTLLVLDEGGALAELARMRGRQVAALEKILARCLTPKGRPRKKRPGSFAAAGADLARDPAASATIAQTVAACRRAGLLAEIAVLGFRVPRAGLCRCLEALPAPAQVQLLADGSALLVCRPNAAPGHLAAAPFAGAAGRVTVGEFCAGGGGMSYGLRQAGGALVYVNELDEQVARIHALNHGVPVDVRPLLDVRAELLSGCAVLAAGFPCQPFSPAGRQRGAADERGLLFLEAVELFANARPLAVILENVAQLAAAKHQAHFRRIIARLKGAGYRVSWQVLNAADYGVPQDRRRLFIVAYRADMGLCFDFAALEKVARKATIEEAIGHLAGRAQVTSAGGIGSLDEYAADMFSRTFRSSTRVRGPRQQAYTVPAHAGGGQLHYAPLPEAWEGLPGILRDVGTGCLHRRLTLAEAAALQTFPAAFWIPAGTSFRLAHRIIGNAVPPLLAEVIARQVITDVGAFLNGTADRTNEAPPRGALARAS